MSENICCPNLRIKRCGDTKQHKHFACDYKVTISGLEKMQFESYLMNNDWIKVYCICEFERCKYFPKVG